MKESGPALNRFSVINLVAWLLCLLAAFCLWLYVMTVESPEYEQTFSHLTVELTGQEALERNNLALYSGYGTMVDVTLSGKKSITSKLTGREIVVTADLSGISEGGRYPCKIKVDVPRGCKLSGLSQDTISVLVDESVTVYMDLTEQRENTNLPENCFVGTVELPTDKISITGPRSYVNSVRAARVTLDLSDVQRTTTMTEDVVLLNSHGVEVDSPYLIYEPQSITVTVPVYKSVEVPIPLSFRWGFLDETKADVGIVPASVVVTGNPDVIDQGNLIEPVVIDEKTEIDPSQLQLSKTVTLTGREGVTLSQTAANVTVTVNPDIKTRLILVPGTNILDTGAREGVHYTWEREPVAVTFMGPVDVLPKLAADDIDLVFDMSPYSSSNTGTAIVRAEVNVDSPYRSYVIALGTYEIAVTFTEE